MALLASVSGVRGTLGGRPSEGLTPPDLLRYVSAFGRWLQQKSRNRRLVLGRDARPSGGWCAQLVAAVLQAMGFDVLDIGLTTTPTTQMEILATKATGGIMISASHNPSEWNALKFLSEAGEFISPSAVQAILELSESEVTYATQHEQGSFSEQSGAIERHIAAILALPLVDAKAVASRGFKVALDAVNSTGGLAILPMLEAMGVAEVVQLNCEPTGHFSHSPEPLPENIGELCACVQERGLDLGLAVDPDVDRLALVAEDGSPFGEEYTLVAVADYVLAQQPGPCVSNLSSSRALQDIATRHGQLYYAAAVGEVHVVEEMRRRGAVIGGEGNGGVIYPDLHAGRDALLGAALFLTHLAKQGCSARALRDKYPSYQMQKRKIPLPTEADIGDLLKKISQQYNTYPQQNKDGLRIDFPKKWVHLRPSNTEPILRIYTEAEQAAEAADLAEVFVALLQKVT